MFIFKQQENGRFHCLCNSDAGSSKTNISDERFCRMHCVNWWNKRALDERWSEPVGEVFGVNDLVESIFGIWKYFSSFVAEQLRTAF